MFSGLTFMEMEENPVMVIIETNVKRKKTHDGICFFTTNGITQNHKGKFITMNFFLYKKH